MVCLSNPENLRIKYKYSIENNKDLKFSLAHNRKMKNTAEDQTSAINKKVILTKAMIGREESNVIIKKAWVL